MPNIVAREEVKSLHGLASKGFRKARRKSAILAVQFNNVRHARAQKLEHEAIMGPIRASKSKKIQHLIDMEPPRVVAWKGGHCPQDFGLTFMLRLGNYNLDGDISVFSRCEVRNTRFSYSVPCGSG